MFLNSNLIQISWYLISHLAQLSPPCPIVTKQKCDAFSCLLAFGQTVPGTGMPDSLLAQRSGVSSPRRLPWSSEWRLLLAALWAFQSLTFACDRLGMYLLLWTRSSLRPGKMSYQFLRLYLLGGNYSILINNIRSGVGQPCAHFCIFTTCANLERLLHL